MATLIINEQFPGNSSQEIAAGLVSRGWSPQSDKWGCGYVMEANDPVLHRNVWYAKWSREDAGRDPGLPDCHSYAITYNRINASNFQNGITIRVLTKYHNLIYHSVASNNHIGIRYNPLQSSLANVNGQTLLETWLNNRGNSPNDRPYVNKRTFYVYDGGKRGYTYNTAPASFLEDDQWYDVVWYSNPNTGENRIYWKEYNTSSWNQLPTITGSRFGVNNPAIGIGAYLHGGVGGGGEAREYFAQYAIYAGDAMADGDIEDGDNGGGTEPDDPLAISNHISKTTDTTATISWETNKEANTVVDYGPTVTRGTVVRGAENATDHEVNLADLTPETQYYYRFSSRTTDGSETVMDQENSTFTTKATGGGGTEPGEVALNDLTDVHLASPAEGDALVYNGTTWVNADLDAIVDEKVSVALADLDNQIEAKVVEVLEKTKIVVS